MRLVWFHSDLNVERSISDWYFLSLRSKIFATRFARRICIQMLLLNRYLLVSTVLMRSRLSSTKFFDDLLILPEVPIRVFKFTISVLSNSFFLDQSIHSVQIVNRGHLVSPLPEREIAKLRICFLNIRIMSYNCKHENFKKIFTMEKVVWENLHRRIAKWNRNTFQKFK